MKTLLALFVVISTTLAFAAEVPVLDTEIRLNRNFYRTDVDARFQMDTSNGEGFVKVSVSQERTVVIYNRFPSPYPGHYPFPGGRYPYPDHRFPETRTERLRVFEDMVRVEGLSLVGDKVIYQGEEGEVDCGTLGVSRVFKVPTIYLTGNCKLTARVVETSSQSRVVIKLITK